MRDNQQFWDYVEGDNAAKLPFPMKELNDKEKELFYKACVILHNISAEYNCADLVYKKSNELNKLCEYMNTLLDGKDDNLKKEISRSLIYFIFLSDTDDYIETIRKNRLFIDLCDCGKVSEYIRIKLNI